VEYELASARLHFLSGGGKMVIMYLGIDCSDESSFVLLSTK
jgi:hypothetical protein